MDSQLQETAAGGLLQPRLPAPPPFSLAAAGVESRPGGRKLPWSPGGLRRHHEIIARISRIFRQKRMSEFMRRFKPDRRTRILDVGGLPRFWQGVPLEAQLTLINLGPLAPHEAEQLAPNQTFLQADATRLPWGEEAFDVVFSNSVIEHLGSWEKQVAFACECRRVGKSWWIQTPAREFPVEPHYAALFLHWFPKRFRRRLLRHFSLWGWLARPGPDALEASLAELRLLTSREFRSLFPDSQIKTERLFGLPKSYIAFKPPRA